MNEGGGPASRDSAGQGARGASAGVDGDARGFSRTVDRDVSSGPAREASGGDAAGTTGLGADAPGSGGREPGRGDPDQGGVGQGGPGQGGSGKSVATVFGEIVWLMSQDKAARELPIKDLEWLVMPPILLKQFHIVYAPVADGRTVKGEAVRKTGAEGTKERLQPVAVELYAMCSDAVAMALDAAEPGQLALTMQDWRSGPNKRAVRKVAPFAAAAVTKPALSESLAAKEGRPS